MRFFNYEPEGLAKPIVHYELLSTTLLLFLLTFLSKKVRKTPNEKNLLRLAAGSDSFSSQCHVVYHIKKDTFENVIHYLQKVIIYFK